MKPREKKVRSVNRFTFLYLYRAIFDQPKFNASDIKYVEQLSDVMIVSLCLLLLLKR